MQNSQRGSIYNNRSTGRTQSFNGVHPERNRGDQLNRLATARRREIGVVLVCRLDRWGRFRLYWRHLSQHKDPGRPKVGAEIRSLVKEMATANPPVGSAQNPL